MNVEDRTKSPRMCPELAGISFFPFSLTGLYNSSVKHIFFQFASQRPVDGSQNPSRSRSFGGGALKSGEEGLPYALRRVFPHPKLFLVLTPVNGLVPLAYLHNACGIKAWWFWISCRMLQTWKWECNVWERFLNFSYKHSTKTQGPAHRCTCFCERSRTASLKSAPSMIAPPRSLRVRTDLTSTAFVRLASLRTCSEAFRSHINNTTCNYRHFWMIRQS